MNKYLNLHPPSFIKQRLEGLGLRQIVPEDITSDLNVLYRRFPDLAGDIRAIGVSDFEGHCQS